MMIFYTPSHEWVRLDGDVATVGITRHAAEELGELVFVEAKEAGTSLAQGEAAAVVESVKAASDIYAPVAGEITGSNEQLSDSPHLVSEDPEGAGWIFTLRISDRSQLDGLLDATAYRASL